MKEYYMGFLLLIVLLLIMMSLDVYTTKTNQTHVFKIISFFATFGLVYMFIMYDKTKYNGRHVFTSDVNDRCDAIKDISVFNKCDSNNVKTTKEYDKIELP